MGKDQLAVTSHPVYHPELLILISKELPSALLSPVTGLCSVKGMTAFKLYLFHEAFIDRFTF